MRGWISPGALRPGLQPDCGSGNYANGNAQIEKIVRTFASLKEVSRMDELVKTLCDKTGLPEDKARMAADTVINFIKSKLPSSVSGQLDNALTGQGSGSITDRLGGILGKKAA